MAKERILIVNADSRRENQERVITRIEEMAAELDYMGCEFEATLSQDIAQVVELVTAGDFSKVIIVTDQSVAFAESLKQTIIAMGLITEVFVITHVLPLESKVIYLSTTFLDSRGVAAALFTNPQSLR